MNATDRINTLRARVLAGEEITKEESAEALALLRTDRAAIPTTKPTPPPIDLNTLFPPATPPSEG